MADGDDLPFSNAELNQALLARLLPPDGADRPAAWIEPAGPGELVVHVGDRSRVVAVGDQTGPAAARVVALVIAELLSAAPAPVAAPAAPAPDAPSRPVAIAAERPAERPARRTATASAAATQVSVTAGLSKGTAAEELAAGTVDADLVLPLGQGRVRVAPSIGLVEMPTRNASTYDEVSYRAGVARLLGGASWGPVDLLGGPFVSSYVVNGATHANGVLFGGELMARVAVPLWRGLRGVAAARGDVYGDRVRVRWVDGNSYATPRVGFSLGLGLAWAWPA